MANELTRLKDVVVFTAASFHRISALSCRWDVNPAGGYQVRVRHFGANPDRLQPRFLVRLGEEHQQVLMVQPTSEIVEVRGKRHWSLESEEIGFTARLAGDLGKIVLPP